MRSWAWRGLELDCNVREISARMSHGGGGKVERGGERDVVVLMT